MSALQVARAHDDRKRQQEDIRRFKAEREALAREEERCSQRKGVLAELEECYVHNVSLAEEAMMRRLRIEEVDAHVRIAREEKASRERVAATRAQMMTEVAMREKAMQTQEDALDRRRAAVHGELLMLAQTLAKSQEQLVKQMGHLARQRKHLEIGLTDLNRYNDLQQYSSGAFGEDVLRTSTLHNTMNLSVAGTNASARAGDSAQGDTSMRFDDGDDDDGGGGDGGDGAEFGLSLDVEAYGEVSVNSSPPHRTFGRETAPCKFYSPGARVLKSPKDSGSRVWH